MNRSHTIYISSKFRDSGTSSNYVVSLPQIIDSKTNIQNFKISLQNFTTYNSWFIIKNTADSINVNGTLFKLPHGNYTYQKLAKVLQSLVLSSSVQWIQEQNKIAFSFTSNTNISFDGLGTTLGFQPYQIYSGLMIISPDPMMPYPDPHIFIHLQNIAPMAEHLILSNHSGQMRMASILAKVLINASPFQLITHQQVLESQGIITADNTLNTLEIFITNSNGEELIDLPEHELVLSIESVDVDDFDAKDMIKELTEIKTWLRDIATMKVLKQQTPRKILGF
jgi:hypothetical protein